jgi:predicted enzyme related to lactoylglutathione lyase
MQAASILDFQVDDVDAEYDRIAAMGVTWPMPPPSPGTARAMIFTDPDGSLINMFCRT